MATTRLMPLHTGKGHRICLLLYKEIPVNPRRFRKCSYTCCACYSSKNRIDSNVCSCYN